MAEILPIHLAGRMAYDTRWDKLAASRENYRVLAAVLLGLLVFQSFVIWRLATQAQVYTYLVEVDRHGQPLYVGPAQAKPLPEDRLMRWTLVAFIRNLRSVPNDPDQLRFHLADATAFLRGDALNAVKGYFAQNNPWEIARASSVALNPRDIVVLRRGKRQWQIEWTEVHQERSGQRLEERWQALVSTVIDPASVDRKGDPTLQLLNPMGIYVTDLDWTRLSRRDV